MLNVYADFLAEDMAIPVIKGQKTEKEKFAGAEATYTVEALKDFRAKLDDSDRSPGYKFADQEMRGIPLRIEIGPKDIEAGKCVIVTSRCIPFEQENLSGTCVCCGKPATKMVYWG